MQLVRTTIRLEKPIKRQAEKLAFNKELTFQRVVNDALREYLQKQAKKKAGVFFIPTHDLGTPLDNLKRSDYYDEPKF